MKSQKTVLDPPYLDDEEKEIMEAYNEAYKDKNEPIDADFKGRKKELEIMAKNSLKARKKQIGIRLNQFDLAEIQKNAEHMGIPYQTLISSVLHQYAQGTLELIPRRNDQRNPQSLKTKENENSSYSKKTVSQS